MKPIRFLTVLGLCFSIVALGQLCWGAEVADTAGELIAALKDVPADKPVYRVNDAGQTHKGVSVDYGGFAVLIDAAPVVPPPLEPTVRVPFGNFALQPGSDDVQPANSGRRISEAQLRLAGVDGLTIRARPHWDYMPFYQSCLDRCVKTGDKATLLMMGGITATPWDESNLKRYEAIAAAMGAKFADHPAVVGVHCTGASNPGASEELHWKQPMDSRAIAANKRLIDVWAKAFPKQTILLAIGGGDPAAMNQIIDYGLAKYPGRLLVKNNSMKAATTLTASHNKLVVDAGKRGSMIGWEMVGSTLESRFGGTMQTAFKHMDTLTAQAGKPRRQSYRAIYMPDLAKLGTIP